MYLVCLRLIIIKLQKKKKTINYCIKSKKVKIVIQAFIFPIYKYIWTHLVYF